MGNVEFALSKCRVTRSYFRASESSRPRKDLKISDIITYRFHTAISGGTPEKIIFILCAITPFLLFCSALYKRVATKDSWFTCVYKTYCTLLRTPSSVSREKEPAPALVLNGMYPFCGVLCVCLCAQILVCRLFSPFNYDVMLQGYFCVDCGCMESC